MGRKKDDGRGRLGGRTIGTANKNNPIKEYLRTHSALYFAPGSGDDGMRSRFEDDLDRLDAATRVDAEIKLLNYHTPKMQTATVDMTLSETKTIEDRLLELSASVDSEN